MKSIRKGFASVFSVFLVGVAIILVINIFNNKAKLQPSIVTGPSPDVTTDATLEKINDQWALYKDYKHGFSFEVPWSEGDKLDETKTNIQYQYELTNYTSFGTQTSVRYIENSQDLTLDNVIINYFNSIKWTGGEFNYKSLPDGYLPYNPGGALDIYINRNASGGGANQQEIFVMSPDKKFVLNIFTILNTEMVDHILSTLEFD